MAMLLAVAVGLLVYALASASADEINDATAASPTDAISSQVLQPRAYSYERVRLARDLARRVTWTDETIFSLTDDRRGPLVQAWREALKASLLGEEHRVAAAAEAFTAALEELEANQPLASSIQFALLENLDSLLALPEWIALPQDLRTDILRRVESISKPVEDDDATHTPLDLATRWYRALLFNDEAGALKAKQGTATSPSLERSLRDTLNAEGLMYTTGLARHVETTARLHTLLHALRGRDSESYQQLAVYARPMVAVLCELLYPNAEWPYALAESAPRFEQLAILLERSYMLFGDSSVLYTLHALYGHRPRPPEGLLLGPSAIPTQRLAFSSALLPQTGAALLRNGSVERPVSVLFDTGLSRLGPAAGPLSIEMRVGDRQWTPPPKQRGAFDLNTVLINGRNPYHPTEDPEYSQNALLLSMKEFPGVGVYAHATATGRYSEAPAYTPSSGFTLGTYERVLFLMDDVVLDFFRVRGGEIHQYQYHAPASWQADFTEEESETTPVSSLSARTDPWLQHHIGEIRQARVEGAFALTTAADGIGERLWFLNPTASEFITLQASEGPDFVVNRYPGEPGEGNLFTVVHEFFEERAPQSQVVPLMLTPQPNRRSFQAVAFALERPDRTDIFFSTTDPSVLYQSEYAGQPFEFQGRFGHVRLDGGDFDSMRLVGGMYLRYGEHAVRLNTPMLNGVVQSVDAESGKLQLGFPYGLPKQPDYVRESLLVTSQNPVATYFQPLLIETDDYKFETDPQLAHAAQPLLLQNNAPHLGISIESGDSALVESVAILEKAEVIGHEVYRLVFSAPAEASIAAQENRNRVQILASTLVSRFRGERDGGAIVFSIEPDESLDGIIEFTTAQ